MTGLDGWYCTRAVNIPRFQVSKKKGGMTKVPLLGAFLKMSMFCWEVSVCHQHISSFIIFQDS